MNTPQGFDVAQAIGWECWRHYRNRWRQVMSMWNTNTQFWHQTGGIVYNLNDIIRTDDRNRMRLKERSFRDHWKHAADILSESEEGRAIAYGVLKEDAFEKVFGDHYDISGLQKLGSYLVWHGLQDPDVREHIGKLVETNVQHPDTEFGGFIRLTGELGIEIVERPNLAEGLSFGWDERELRYAPNFACFHTHAIADDCTEFYGPSGFVLNPGSDYWRTDHFFAMRHAERASEFRGVVFTKLPGKKFAAHYFCTDSSTHNEARTALGTHFRNFAQAIFLGEFTYEGNFRVMKTGKKRPKPPEPERLYGNLVCAEVASVDECIEREGLELTPEKYLAIADTRDYSYSPNHGEEFVVRTDGGEYTVFVKGVTKHGGKEFGVVQEVRKGQDIRQPRRLIRVYENRSVS